MRIFNSVFWFPFSMIFAACLFGPKLDAQVNSVKLYSNFMYAYAGYAPDFYNYERSPFKFYGLSAAHRRKNHKSKLHEWEAMILFKKVNNAEEQSDLQLYQLRYQFGKYIFNKFFRKKSKLQLAYAFKLFYGEENFQLGGYNDWPGWRKQGGVTFNIFTHFEYHLNDQIYFDINTILIGINAQLDFNFVDNPVLTERQKQQGGFELLDDSRILRIGIGYKFYPKPEEDKSPF